MSGDKPKTKPTTSTEYSPAGFEHSKQREGQVMAIDTPSDEAGPGSLHPSVRGSSRYSKRQTEDHAICLHVATCYSAGPFRRQVRRVILLRCSLGRD